ncbi:MAG: hypothetical protein HQM13_22405 [SAR324 cluster bacterium]|nr:hypothetical protein [SAR324 cluster bacterium]
MIKPIINEAITEIPKILTEYVDDSSGGISVHQHPEGEGIDLIVTIGDKSYAAQCKKTNTRASLLLTLTQFKEQSEEHKTHYPLLIVPFMAEAGKELCKEYSVSWIDLSGNAHIKVPGFFVHVTGKSNKYKQTGRPTNLFAPKSSRIVRYLLVNAGSYFAQRELSHHTDLDEGFTSKIVRRLEKEELILRNDDGGVCANNPEHLLNCWYDAYDFKRHKIIKGHISARSGEQLMNQVSQRLTQQNIQYATTGLGAAWQLTHFAAFRTVSFYLYEPPTSDLWDALNFREDERGANIWFVLPNDEGVFQGCKDVDGINCVHPVQLYLDLKEHPERASETAEQLRKQYLTWKGINA